VTWLLLIPTMAAVAAAAWLPRLAGPAAETISGALGEPEEREESAEPPECPSWCAEQPGHQTGHHALIGARHAQGGTWMQVELIQLADQEAQVHLGVYPSLDEPGLEAHLTPVEAAVMAALIAADGTPDGHDWLARALAEAAQAAGAPRCQDCGRIGAGVHPEYDRQEGRVVRRCGACHQAALTGTGVAR
jgi:hypothetical protein